MQAGEGADEARKPAGWLVEAQRVERCLGGPAPPRAAVPGCCRVEVLQRLGAVVQGPAARAQLVVAQDEVAQVDQAAQLPLTQRGQPVAIQVQCAQGRRSERRAARERMVMPATSLGAAGPSCWPGPGAAQSR